MKLIFDLLKSVFSRLFILLLVATILIVMEANRQSEAALSATETRIQSAINKVNKQITLQNRTLQTYGKKQTSLKSKIAKNTKQLNTINEKLEASRKAKLKNKLPPWKVTEYQIDTVKLSVYRATLVVDYSKVMFDTVDINKKIAQNTIKKTELNSQLIAAQSSNTIDYILKQDSPTDLLTASNRVLLLALFYGLFFGALSIKIINYYLFAPLARKTKAIVINSGEETHEPHIQYDTPQKDFTLQVTPNHNLIVKPGWYNLNTEGITKTRFFWDTKKPFASYAMGLVNMTEFEPDKTEVREIKIASDNDPNQNIIPIHLNEHPGYVVRHGHVVATSGNELVMKKQWRFGDWKSWLFGSIRYVYFSGTGTVYISGYGRVSTNDNTANSRIQERHVIGFDTRAAFKVLRTETFTNYWLNNKPLYDIHFPQQGRYLQQQSIGQGDQKIFRSLFEDIVGAIGKFLGF